MKTLSVIASIALLATGTAALAETAQQRAACTPDVWRLCAAEIPDIGAIKSCLRRERTHLSVACRTVMDAADKPVQAVAAK